ncbi:MAG: 7-cyano-7-deazaguanine synthase QueC [Candidatus Omnitrophica bacterium]|nr:7-cyano-7-deazaguanine synthase QueC [Candidatus Omnitrophota bacterium]
MINKQPKARGKKAVVLLSGGLDSSVVLYLAKKKGFQCFCLAFDYKQRHSRELKSARAIAQSAKCGIEVMKVSFPWKGSSLLEKKAALPGERRALPNTYVPGRNIIFLSFALSYAEAIKAKAIFIGAHAQDYSGYPDCRRAFFQAFKKVVDTGTRAGKGIQVFTPLIDKSKAGIIKTGVKLNVPFNLTWSCYKGGLKPCGKCDSCFYRAKGFKEAAMEDPLTL